MNVRFSVVVLIALLVATGSSADAAVSVAPKEVQLHGPNSRQQLIVSDQLEGRDVDLTRTTKFATSDSNIATVNADGLITPVGNGSTTIRVMSPSGELTVPVNVTSAKTPLPLDFLNDIQPVLTDGGCNSGPCHGKARGQGGFKLSLFGFDSAFDYSALSMEGRGRRVFLSSPERSLLLLKPAGQVPHGGGLRLREDGTAYATLKRWIEAGMPQKYDQAPELVEVVVEPNARLMNFEAAQQLIVTAKYSDGSTRDVTSLSAYQSNESGIASVNDDGLVSTTKITGEAAIMARYMGKIAVASIFVPLKERVPESLYEQLPQQNFIDGLVWKKLQRLGLTPSEAAPDNVFLRRVYIDVIGRVPTAEETRTFLADETADKRAKLIDALLEHPEYADHWANKWVDLLRPNPYRAGIKTVLNYDNWIRNSFRKNVPYDQFVRNLITAKGGTWRNGAVTLFRDRRSPDELTTIVSQLFLGIRLECAKCHQHPNEVWGQNHFFGFAAYFDSIGRKGTGLSPPISGSEEFFFVGKRTPVKHPLTNENMEYSPLFGEAPVPEGMNDPREALASWMTSAENPFFRQVIANRIWRDMMGRGIVEPVDDLRASNPPSNPELLEALALDLRDSGYDLKHLIRRIANSYVYGLSSLPSATNTVDTRNYSRFLRERLRAEVLLDSVSQITAVPEKFAAMPPGSQARQLWSHRISSLFLDAFGRPDPNQDPPCERTPDTTIVQALHLMNSQGLYDKVTSDSGTAASLATGEQPNEKIVEELYLSVFNRFPTDTEATATKKFLDDSGEKRRKAVEDLLWAMLNTPEFIFKH